MILSTTSSFRLLGVPVRVHPFFWAVSAIMGFQAFEYDIPAVVLWMCCVVLSIMVHEFGHALASKAFFCSPSVVLWGDGRPLLQPGGATNPGAAAWQGASGRTRGRISPFRPCGAGVLDSSRDSHRNEQGHLIGYLFRVFADSRQRSSKSSASVFWSTR